MMRIERDFAIPSGKKTNKNHRHIHGISKYREKGEKNAEIQANISNNWNEFFVTHENGYAMDAAKKNQECSMCA